MLTKRNKKKVQARLSFPRQCQALRGLLWDKFIYQQDYISYTGHCNTLRYTRPSADMICSPCRRLLLSQHSSRFCTTPQLRQTSTAPSTSSSPGQPSPNIKLPTAKNNHSETFSNLPDLSQPPSTPMPPTTSSPSTPNQSKESKQQKLVGSIPGGTPLLGLAYLKAKPLVLAKEDDEYPDWLWTLLAPESGSTSKGMKSAACLASRPSSYLPLMLHKFSF